MAKLEVLGSYLHDYYDTLNPYVGQDTFRLDVVDGFAGGGLFLHDGQEQPGSPLIMLNEASKAEQRLNQQRTKRLQFDVKHHFVESEPAHAEYLRSVLQDRGYLQQVALYPACDVNDVLDRIIFDIRGRQPISGRSIFLLDQCGYTGVDLKTVRHIGALLAKAEVILTVSIGAMLNFATRENIVPLLVSFGVRKDLVEAALRGADNSSFRALVQRALPTLIMKSTDFKYFTSFFLMPADSRRALWFAHFSRSAKAHDVMRACHWKIRNSFAHYGSSLGPNMMGYEALESSEVPLLTFNDRDRAEMNDRIAEQLMRELHRRDQPMRFRDMFERFSNITAATSSDCNDVALMMRDAGEVHIQRKDGRRRSNSLKNLTPDDRIVLPRQLTLAVGKIGKRES